MLLNVSYNDKKIKEKLLDEVGKPFSFFERIKMKGNGSPGLKITEASAEITQLLDLDSNANKCNVEIRQKGILVGFRSLLESFALVIPYHKLTLYKGKPEEYSIYRDEHFIKVKADHPAIHEFFQKVQEYKSDHTPAKVDDL